MPHAAPPGGWRRRHGIGTPWRRSLRVLLTALNCSGTLQGWLGKAEEQHRVPEFI